jgi:hypothetical protein
MALDRGGSCVGNRDPLRHLRAGAAPARSNHGGGVADQRALHRAARRVHLRPPGRVRLVTAAQRRQPPEPRWRGPFISATHCGAACTLGDIIGESAVFAGSWAIAGAALWPEYIVDFTLAWVLGILFQYFAIKPTSGLAPSGRSSRLRRGLHARRACIQVPEGHQLRLAARGPQHSTRRCGRSS